MEPSQGWWARRPQIPAAGLVALAVALGLVAATLGVTAMIRLPARGTSCNASTAAAEVFPALVAVGGPGAQPTATGTVIRGNGVILTGLAALPAGGKGPVSVTLSVGESVPATVVGTDAATALAVLKIDRQQLPFLLPAPREPVHPGLPVVALASPLLSDGGVLAGTVQGTGVTVPVAGRPAWTLTGATTTDLPVPGGAGAPVVTCENRLIGIVVGQASDGSAVLVPADAAHRVVSRLLGLS